MSVDKINSMYDAIASATGIPRETVKKVIYGYSYSGPDDNHAVNLAQLQLLERIANALEGINNVSQEALIMKQRNEW